MASVPDICNLALGHLGDSATVASISPPDGSAQAAHCQRLYPIARDIVLEKHTWSFATMRLIAASVTNTLSSWAYAYALPANCLRLVSVLPQSATDDAATEPFIIEQDGFGNQIVYCNTQNATFRLIIRVTDTTKYSAAVVETISYRLAAFLAGPVLKGKIGVQTSSAMMSLFKDSLGSAQEIDANQSRTNTIRDYQPMHLPDRSTPSQGYGGQTPGFCR
jgi:hypothetical protein